MLYTLKKFILDAIYAIMYFMIKPKKHRNVGTYKRSSNLLYINLLILFIMGITVFSACSQSAPLINTPTPIPSQTHIPTHTPVSDALGSKELKLNTSSNATPLYDESYPTPDVLGNTGANIENGGLSTSDSNKLYYIDNGIWSMSKDGENKVQISDMQNISCLNNAGDYIYFLSTHDGSVYRVKKASDAVPEFLNITGASNLIIIGEYLYYCSTIGEDATHFIYKSPLQGIVQECLFIKATSITPDGAYFYFNNLEDEGTLWRYDTISSQIVKISNDKASQINVINEKLYYISEDLDYNVVCIDRNGLDQVVVVTKGCTDLNTIQNYLVYRTIDTGHIQSYNISTGETVTLVSYGDLFSLSATCSMLLFQSCPADGFEPETYIYNFATSKLNKSLPQKIYAYVKDIDLANLTFEYDRVYFYEGEEAIKQFSAYNSTSIEEAEEALTTDDGIYYIYNNQQAWLPVQSLDWTKITLIRRSTSLSNNTPYTANLEQLQALFDNYNGTEEKLLFEITINDKKVVEMNEVYYTINTDK